MRPKPFAILVAGLILLGLLLLLPRARSTMSGLLGRSRPASTAGDDSAARAARAVPGSDVDKPDWPPKAPPPKSPRPKPQSNPLDRLAKGIAAMPAGSDAAYVLREKTTSTFFTNTGVVMCSVDLPHQGASAGQKQGYAVKWSVAGAASVAPRAEGERSDKFHTYNGSDKSKWVTEQASYSTIAYDSVLPGVDLQFETRPNAVKYTVNLAPGADPSALRFHVEGAHGITVGEGGASVEITTAVGPITEDGLVCYQEGPEGRRVVQARYEKAGAVEYAIVVGEHDPDLPLVIDPVIKWSSYLGGTQSPQGNDDGLSVAVDPVGGFVYAAGTTYCVDMPHNVGASTLKGTQDGFLTKLDPGGFFIWYQYIGGTQVDSCNAVAVESGGGAIYVTGYTGSSDFPVLNALYPVSNGGYDAFVMKINPAGSVVWSTYLGGYSTEYGNAIGLDSSNNVYVSGYTYSGNFPVQLPFRATMTSGPDGFITKINSAGTGLMWSSFLGGNSSDVVYGMAVDSVGNAYVTGYTYSTDFPNTVPPGGPLKGTVDAFLMKVNNNGSFGWSALLGGTNSDYGQAVCITNDVAPGDPVVVGYTYSSDFAPVPNPLLAAKPFFLGGTIDGFVVRYAANGSGAMWSTYIGGNSYDYAYAAAPGASGSVYVGGYTISNNFPNLGGYRPTVVNPYDGFVTRIAADGTSFLNTTYYGGSSSDYLRGMTSVLSGANAGVYFVGQTFSTDLPQPNTFRADATLGGQSDAFIAKLNLTLTASPWCTYFGGDNSVGDDWGYAVGMDPTNVDNVYVSGYTTSGNFPTVGSPVLDPTLGGLQDAFITKLTFNGGVGPASIVWSTYWGGSSYEYVSGLAVDNAGWPYVVGYTWSFDFPVGGPAPGPFQTTSTGTPDAFVVNLNPNGLFYYSTYVGGNNYDYGYGIAVDNALCAYVTGITYSTNFPVSPGGPYGASAPAAAKGTMTSAPDAFVVKLDPNGKGLWGTFLGGNNSDYGYGIAVTPTADATQRVYITGETWSTDFVSGATPTVDNTLNIAPDAFATSLNGLSGAFVWSRYLGGSNSDYGRCVAVDAAGLAPVFSGYTYSTDFPTTAGVVKQFVGTDWPDAYVTRLNPATGAHNTGSAWSTYLGGFSNEWPTGVAVDGSQNVYVAGYTYSSNFPIKGAVQPLFGGSIDSFVTKIYANGSALAWSTFLGGINEDYVYAISVHPSGPVYVAGVTNSPNFPFNSGFDNALGGQWDAFIVRYDNANPDPPDFSLPTTTGQFKIGGITQLAVGAWSKEDSFVVKAKVTDSDDDPVKLQIEAKSILVDWDGAVTAESAVFSAPNNILSVTVPFPLGPVHRLHWRARTIDSTGRTSSWVPFGGNSDGAPPGTPAARDIGKDQTGPAVAISSPTPPTFYTTSSSIGMNGTTSDADSGVTSVSWFNGAIPPPQSGGASLFGNNWSVAAIPLAASPPGGATPNVIQISSTDAAGNTSQTSITVYQDVNAPTNTIQGADFATSSNGASLNISATDNVVVGSVTWVNNRGGSGIATFNAGTGFWVANITGMSPGNNQITVTVTDGAGNFTTAVRNIYYDDQPPTVSITSPAVPFYTKVASVNLSGSAADNLALAAGNCITWLNLTNSASGSTSVTLGSWTINGITLKKNSANTIRVRATDSVGRTMDAFFDCIEDEVPPAISFSFPAPGSQFITGTNNISISGTCTDDVGVKAITWARNPAVLPAPPNFDGFLDFQGSTFSPWSVNALPLTAGQNLITVTVTDLAGNTASTITAPPTQEGDVYYDTNAPTITISSPATNPKVTNSSTINITGNASDSNGTVQFISVTNLTTGAPAYTTSNPPPFRVNAPNLGTNNVDWDVTNVGLQAGSNTIQVLAQDNTPLTSVATLTIIYDPTKPTVKITGPTTADTYFTGIGTLLLAGTASDNRAVTQVTWTRTVTGFADLTDVCVGTTSWNVSALAPIPLVLAPAVNTITITAKDEAGNTETDTLVVTYDPTLPDITITSPTVASSMVTTGASVTLGGTASDNIDLQSITWINAATGSSGSITGSLTAWTSPAIVLAAGANPITVIATDLAGNLRTDSIVVSKDISLPTLAVVTPVPTGGTYTTSANNVTLTGTAGDDIGLLSIGWSNAANGTSGSASGLASWTTSTITLQPGNNVITITATDLRPSAPNTSTASITVHYDNSAPLIQILTPTNQPTVNSLVSPIDLGGSASDLTGSGTLVDVTAVTWDNLTTGGKGTAGLTPGAWTASVPMTPGANIIQVTATDAAGRTSSDTITVTYDPAAPVVNIITPTTGLTFATASTPATLAGIASDDVGLQSVTWSTDAAVLPSSGPASGPPDWSTWTASPPLAPGVNTITITATDTVGRTGTARLTITYDPTPPSVAITYPTSDTLFLSTLTPLALGGAASDNLAIQSVTWQNTTTGESGLASGVGAWTISAVNLVQGNNVIKVTATDGVGNQAQASVTVIYDGLPPTVTIDPPVVGPPPFATSTRPLLFTGTAGDNLSLTSVTWVNSKGGGGSALLTPVTATTFTWAASIYLYPGDNDITVTAVDAHGYQTSAMVTVTFTAEGLAPSVNITGPNSTGSATSLTQIVTISGDADDNVGVVSVTWKNKTTGVKGTAILTPVGMTTVVNWTADVPLANGSNVIDVVATDDAGNKTPGTITVDYTTPSDAVVPAINHTSPVLPGVGVYDTSASPVLVTLSASDGGDGNGVTVVTWVNSVTGGAGVATYVTGTVWTATIGLAVGANNLTFTAYDPSGNSAQDVLLVNFAAPVGDPIPPSINITSHSTVTPTNVSVSTLDIVGTAGDNVQLAEIVWFDAATNVSGDADGLDNWTGQLQLVAGVNLITLRAFDTSGNSTTVQMTVVYTPPPPPPPPPVHIQAGACGLVGLEALLAIALAATLRRRSRKGVGR